MASQSRLVVVPVLRFPPNAPVKAVSVPVFNNALTELVFRACGSCALQVPSTQDVTPCKV